MGTLPQAAHPTVSVSQPANAAGTQTLGASRAQSQVQTNVPYKFLRTDGACVGRLLPDGKVEDIGETTEMYPDAATCLAAYGYAIVPDEYLMQLAECFGGVPHIDLSQMQPVVSTVAQAAPTRQPRGKKGQQGQAAQAQQAVPPPQEIPAITRTQVEAAHTDPAVAAFMASQAQAAQAVVTQPASSALQLMEPFSVPVQVPLPVQVIPAVQLATPSAHVPNQPLTLLEKLQAAEIFLAAVGSPYIVDVQHHIAGVRAAEKYLTEMQGRL